MTSKIKYLGNLRTEATHLKSGISIITDAPVDNNGKGEWSGWFMLGSCSEPIMKWQLRLNIKDKDSPSYLYFITQQ